MNRDAIMINVPLDYFKENGSNALAMATREAALRHYYESMGTPKNPEGCFYHFISSIPRIKVLHVYVCWRGYVRFKSKLVEFIRNKPVPEIGHYEARNWCVTAGPVIAAPEKLQQQGFRGFRYCKELF